VASGCRPSSRESVADRSAGGAAGCAHCQYAYGAIIRGDTTQKQISLVFTGDEFADGGDHILAVLRRQQVLGAFFFTGRFYRDPRWGPLIRDLVAAGHYLGAHSDRHLLYCDWQNRDSLLISREMFFADLEANYNEMEKFGISSDQVRIFLPPYEWYNQKISNWCQEKGLLLVSFTPGTLSHADYTVPSMGKKYIPSDSIYRSIISYEESQNQHQGDENDLGHGYLPKV